MPVTAPAEAWIIVVSAAFSPLVDDGFGKGRRRHRHPAAEIGAARKWFGYLGPGRNEPRNGPAAIGNSHLVALAHLFNEGRKVLPRSALAQIPPEGVVVYRRALRQKSANSKDSRM